MKLSTYLLFEGNCREAFSHYQKVLGGTMQAMMDHRGTPAEDQVAPEWRDKILHACLEIDGQLLMASDAPPDRSDGPMRSVSVSIGVKTRRRPSASSPAFPKAMPGSSCRWPRPSGRHASACWSIASAPTGWSAPRCRPIRPIAVEPV